MELAKIFSHSASCHFVQLTVSFSLQKFFSFMWSHLLMLIFVLVLSVWCSGSISRTTVFNAAPYLLSIRFGVSGFMLRSSILLRLSFKQDHKYAQFVEDAFLFTMCISVLLFFIKT